MLRRWWNRLILWLYGESVIQPILDEATRNHTQAVSLLHQAKRELTDLQIRLASDQWDHFEERMRHLTLQIEKLQFIVAERLPVDWDKVPPRPPREFSHAERQ